MDPSAYPLARATLITTLKKKYQAGEFEGMMRYDARVEVEKALEAKGLLRGKDPHKMRLGVCSRSGDIIEPMITPQW